MVARAAVPRPDADAVGRAGALRAGLLGADSRASTTPATRRISTRTATSGSPAGPTRSSRSPAHRIGTIEVETAFLQAPGRGRGGRHRAGPTSCAARSSRPSWCCKQGHEPSPALRHELLATVRHELGPVAVIGELQLRQHAAQDAQRQDHAPRAEGRHAWTRDPGDITTIEDEGSVEEARAGLGATPRRPERPAAGRTRS